MKVSMDLLSRLVHPGRADAFGECQEEYLERPDHSRMRIWVCQPRSPAGRMPVMLWLHGCGNPKDALAQASLMARRLGTQRGCVVVAPEYRSGSAYPYPAALEDAYNTLLWIKNQGEDLGICQDQIFVGGECSGGGLCVALAMLASQRDEVQIAFQMPLYPLLDCPASSPALATGTFDLSSLPPAAILTGNTDPSLALTMEWVGKFRMAGVATSFKVLEGSCHPHRGLVHKPLFSPAAMEFAAAEFARAVDTCHAAQKHFLPLEA